MLVIIYIPILVTLFKFFKFNSNPVKLMLRVEGGANVKLLRCGYYMIYTGHREGYYLYTSPLSPTSFWEAS